MDPFAPKAQPFLRVLFTAYLRIFHRLSAEFVPGLPQSPPFLAITSHFSILDFLAITAVDPYRPAMTTVVKSSLFRSPLAKHVVRAWNCAPAERQGRDFVAARHCIRTLRAGQGLCIAAEGRRSRSGRLGPMHPGATRLVMWAAARGIPVFPIAVNGTFEALPPGGRLPRLHKIHVVFGEPIEFPVESGDGRGRKRRLQVAAIMQAAITRHLPPDRRPRGLGSVQV